MGPVHLNLPFEEPLHASASVLEVLQREVAQGDARREPLAPSLALDAALLPPSLDPDQPGAVVVGPWRGSAAALPAFAEAVRRWQQRSGWPVLADALSGLRGWSGLELVQGYDLLLADGHGLPQAPQLLRLGPVSG